MKILLIGPQACGKGTQGEKLSVRLGLPLVGVGDLLRNIPDTYPRAAEVKKKVNSGELAPYDVAADLIRLRISKKDCARGFILDGWARSVQNLNFFNPGFDLVLYISIPREESLNRISGRRYCETDRKIYNIYTLPQEEISCKGKLIQRDDDKEEAVNRRLDIFYTETKEVIEHFEKQGKLVEIDGLGTPDEVFLRVLKACSDKLSR